MPGAGRVTGRNGQELHEYKGTSLTGREVETQITGLTLQVFSSSLNRKKEDLRIRVEEASARDKYTRR
jgi:hypothetical protein